MLYWKRGEPPEQAAFRLLTAHPTELEQNAMIRSLRARALRPGAIVLAAAALGLAAAGCGSSSSSGVPSGSIAKVGDTSISQAQYDQLLAATTAYYKQQKRPLPKKGTPAYQQLQQQLVARLVQQAQLDVWAKEQGISVSNGEVNQQIDKIKQSIAATVGAKSGKASDAQFQAWLKKQGLTMDYATSLLRQKVESQKLYDKLAAGVTVSDAAVTSYYHKNITSYSTPAERHLRHILVQGPASLAAQVRAQAAANPAQFAVLAKKYSKDTSSAVKGGDLGMWRQGAGVPEFDKAAFALKTGAISQPIPTKILGADKPAFFIVQALGPVQPKSVHPLDAATKVQIRAIIVQQNKQKSVSDAYAKEKAKLDKQTQYAPDYAPPTTATSQTTTT
jgi:peptidyl-prolyl cis-trans isomerase C